MRKIPNSRPNVSRLSQEVTSELPGRQYATVFTVQPQLSFVVPVTIDLLCKTRLTCPARVQRKIQNTDVSKPSEHVICMYLYVGIRLGRNARVCRSAGGRRGDYAHLEAVLLRVNCLKKNQNAPRPSEHSPVRGGEMSKRVFVVVFFTLTDRASTVPSNIPCCQSGTWSAGQKKIRGTSTKLQ